VAVLITVGSSRRAQRALFFCAARAFFSGRVNTVDRRVPFVEDEHTVFLKTIIPSRKATKQYLGEESDDEDGC
jgi:hypothetical protein